MQRSDQKGVKNFSRFQEKSSETAWPKFFVNRFGQNPRKAAPSLGFLFSATVKPRGVRKQLFGKCNSYMNHNLITLRGLIIAENRNPRLAALFLGFRGYFTGIWVTWVCLWAWNVFKMPEKSIGQRSEQKHVTLFSRFQVKSPQHIPLSPSISPAQPPLRYLSYNLKFLEKELLASWVSVRPPNLHGTQVTEKLFLYPLWLNGCRVEKS